MTTPDPYLMPRVDDMLTEIGNTKFLTKMDLNKGFHQIPLREEDQCKTAFVLHGVSGNIQSCPSGYAMHLQFFNA